MNNVITLTTTDWTKIEYNITWDDDWFSFRADADINFSEIPAPWAMEFVPIASWTRHIFKKPIDFFVKWTVGTNIFLAPFDR